MASKEFMFNYTPGKLEEFLTKLQNVGTPDKMGTGYPKGLGFGSSHARNFPALLKHVGLLDSSGAPNDVYKKGLRGGDQGRPLVGQAIKQAYKTLFDVYPNANTHSDADLVQVVKSHSDLDNDKAVLVVKTFKVLCKFGDFDGAGAGSTDGKGSGDDSEHDDGDQGNKGTQRRRKTNTGGSGVTINVNIALSVDATSDPEVYDAFFAAMAKHLKELDGGA